MSVNEGTADRAARAVAGIALAVLALVVGLSQVTGIVLLVVALVLLLTAATGFCPLYRVLGLSTCPVPGRRSGSRA